MATDAKQSGLEVLKQKFDGLNQRERYIVFALVLLLVVVVWDQLLFAPLQRDMAMTEKRMMALTQEINNFGAESQALIANMENNPNAELERDKVRLQGRILKLGTSVEEITSKLIPPQQMAEVLESVLRQNTRLKLVRVTNLPAKTITVSESAPGASVAGDNLAAGAADADGLLYRHAVELELVGEYFDTLRYLQALEQLSWQILWSRLDYQVDTYPQATIRLRLNTLSTTSGWIGV